MSTFRTGGVGLFVLLCLLAAMSGWATAGPRDIERREFPATSGGSLAILIGVQDYLSVSKLKFCWADVEALAEILRQRCGYDAIVTLTDAETDPAGRPTLGNLSNQLRMQLKLANEQGCGRVLIYFSGHGFRDREGRLYLAPPDCDRNNLELTGLPLAHVKQLLDGCTRVPVKLLMLDCCHAGTDKGDGVGVSGDALARSFASARGLLTLASCLDDEVSLEWDEKGRGLFSYWLCQGLAGEADRDRSGVVDSDELHGYLHVKVLETAVSLGREQNTVVRPSADWRGVAALSGPETQVEHVEAGGTTPPPAAPVEAAVAELASEVAGFIRARGESSLALGHILPPPQQVDRVTTGPGLAKRLADDLAAAGLVIESQAALGLEGRFSVPPRNAADGDLLRLKIALSLTDASGEVLKTFSREVDFTAGLQDGSLPETDMDGAGALATMLGVTAELPPDQSALQRHEVLEASLTGRSTAVVDGSRVRPASRSPYGLEIRVHRSEEQPEATAALAKAARPRAPRLEGDSARVDLAAGESYVLCVTNDSPHDAAVTLAIDGQSVFAYSDVAQYRHFIVPKQSTGLIAGWHRTNAYSRAFTLTSYGGGRDKNTVLAPPEVGSITATFAAAWPANQAPPADEPEIPVDRGVQTSQGGAIAAQYDEVRRAVGVVRAAVTIRYDRPE